MDGSWKSEYHVLYFFSCFHIQNHMRGAFVGHSCIKKTVMWKVLYHAKQWGHECCTFWRSFYNILSSTYKLNFQSDISFFLFSIDKFLRYLKLLVSPFLLLKSNCDCNTIETTQSPVLDHILIFEICEDMIGLMLFLKFC